jgi:hypothetical protein
LTSIAAKLKQDVAAFIQSSISANRESSKVIRSVASEALWTMIDPKIIVLFALLLTYSEGAEPQSHSQTRRHRMKRHAKELIKPPARPSAAKRL